MRGCLAVMVFTGLHRVLAGFGGGLALALVSTNTGRGRIQFYVSN